jgi:Leucine-rich repeat (LRR) protein
MAEKMSLICPKCGKQYKSPSFYQKHVEKCTGVVKKAKSKPKSRSTAKVSPKKTAKKNELIILRNQVKNLEDRVSKLEFIIEHANLRAKVEFSEIDSKDIADYNGTPLIRQDHDFLIILEKELGDIPVISQISWNNFGFKAANNRIVGLGLYNQSLKAVPESIGSLISLKELILDSNQLSTLPEGIKNLKSLSKLNLGHNHFEVVPKSILNLPALEELIMWSNKLVDIPETIGNFKILKKLHLFDNNLKSLPNTIGNLESLKILDLKQNELTNLPDSITKLTSLKKLLIKSNKLTTLSENLTEWLNTLKQNGCKIYT